MKIQDIGFIVVLLALIYIRKPKLFVVCALMCIVLSIPLFSFWKFFTAQRLIEYAFALLVIAVILFLTKKR